MEMWKAKGGKPPTRGYVLLPGGRVGRPYAGVHTSDEEAKSDDDEDLEEESNYSGDLTHRKTAGGEQAEIDDECSLEDYSDGDVGDVAAAGDEGTTAETAIEVDEGLTSGGVYVDNRSDREKKSSATKSTVTSERAIADNVESLCFKIKGDPCSLQRARFDPRRNNGRKRFWNPNRSAVRGFQKQMIDSIFGAGLAEMYFKKKEDWKTCFDGKVGLVVDIDFKMKPPNTHFVNRGREGKRLKPSVENKWPRKRDIDNMDKFVLDSMQGVVFDNDVQVVKQTIRKMFHHEGDFEGETVVHVTKIK